MRGSILILSVVIAACGSPSVCPGIPADGGAPIGSCNNDGDTCFEFGTVLVADSCVHDVKYTCTCASEQWECTLSVVDHHVCMLPDGGLR